MKGVLALRFDVDSVTCVERGIPKLRRLADDLGVRFTFFVNMGYSFNWTHNARHFLVRRFSRPSRQTAPADGPTSLPTKAKLGWMGVLKTMALNPRLGDRYRATFDALHAEGHELGLHGGTDHVIWQRSLDDLGNEELEKLFRPAFDTFTERYGRPAGFASPGFRINESVLRLLDTEGFRYASDMSGQYPFHPEMEGGGSYTHYQVPVNVMGEHHVPLVEQSLARGRTAAQTEQDVVDAIDGRDFALLYGHPYVEGVHAPVLGGALKRLRDQFDIVTVGQYLDRWKAEHA